MNAAPLRGVTVGVLQTRHAGVLADLITRRGGRVIVAPVLREEEVEDLEPLRQTLAQLIASPIDLAIFQTGVGVVRLFDLAAEMGHDLSLRDRVAAARVLARGPKPLAALHQRQVRVDLRTAEPHTTAEMIDLLEPDLRDRTVFLQQHGEPNRELAGVIRNRGARLLEAFTYRWALPDDLGPAVHFLDLLAAGEIDVTVFTSAAQVKNLFAIARRSGRDGDARGSLADRTLVASIGPTTSAALAEMGLQAGIQPAHPKMVPLVEAVSAHYRRDRPG